MILTSPDCRDGKHTSCTGQGWDDTVGLVVDCPCSCHTTDTGADADSRAPWFMRGNAAPPTRS